MATLSTTTPLGVLATGLPAAGPSEPPVERAGNSRAMRAKRDDAKFRAWLAAPTTPQGMVTTTMPAQAQGGYHPAYPKGETTMVSPSKTTGHPHDADTKGATVVVSPSSGASPLTISLQQRGCGVPPQVEARGLFAVPTPSPTLADLIAREQLRTRIEAAVARLIAVGDALPDGGRIDA